MAAPTTRRISRLISDFRWVHTGLGLIKEFGVWLFIVGSFGMLIGSLGEAVVRYERHRLNI